MFRQLKKFKGNLVILRMMLNYYSWNVGGLESPDGKYFVRIFPNN